MNISLDRASAGHAEGGEQVRGGLRVRQSFWAVTSQAQPLAGQGARQPAGSSYH